MSDTVGNNPAGEPGRSGKGSGFLAFWKTLPGILTGIAAVITAATGIVALTLQMNDDPASKQPQLPPATEPADQTSGTGPGAKTTTTPSPKAGAKAEPGVLHRDRVEMENTNTVDLETGRVGGANEDFYLHGTEDIVAWFGMTKTSGPMTKDRCGSALQDKNDGGIRGLSQTRDDEWLCVQTKERNLAGVRVVKKAGPGQKAVVFEYVLWK